MYLNRVQSILLYWSRFLLLWTQMPNKQTKVYFHELSRPTPPPQVVYKPWLINIWVKVTKLQLCTNYNSESEAKTPTFKMSGEETMTKTFTKIGVLDHPAFYLNPPPPSPPAPPAWTLSFLFSFPCLAFGEGQWRLQGGGTSIGQWCRRRPSSPPSPLCVFADRQTEKNRLPGCRISSVSYHDDDELGWVGLSWVELEFKRPGTLPRYTGVV